ncbi:MAG: ATP-binding cassette domain-containing protein, partial [Deltaproteobacteria bacterium]|nr:ATP-binding cassette domain-containing protein [Deltaproteobacteria bacterium]
MTAVLEVRNLVKHYPGVIAVDGISFAIPQGICFGLIGPNGAGKTTTIEIIEGIIPHFFGEILYKRSPKTSSFQEEVGIQFQATSLFSFLTVQESLETFHNLYRDPMPLEKVIQLCRLEDILNRRNDKLS